MGFFSKAPNTARMAGECQREWTESANEATDLPRQCKKARTKPPTCLGSAKKRERSHRASSGPLEARTEASPRGDRKKRANEAIDPVHPKRKRANEAIDPVHPKRKRANEAIDQVVAVG
jgi:hypothetical protein